MSRLADLCGTDNGKWTECEEVINFALAARMMLRDGILEKILESR